jgi:hypothetical protein
MSTNEAVLSLSPAAVAALEAEREARRAAAFVAVFVGVPAIVAAGAMLVLFALTAVVLLGPVVAAALTWAAWRYGRPARPAA